jgi:hypothetical protein
MPDATLAALEAAVAKSSLDDWLALLPDERVRVEARRALEMDRRLWTAHPASLASCLLARTHGIEGFSEIHRAFARELDERGSPWIRTLRGLPVAAGLLAELREGGEIDLQSLWVPSFESDEVLLLAPYPYQASLERRLLWRWSRGDARMVQDPRLGAPRSRDRWPRFEKDGWGPVSLVRAPGAASIALPCPEEGSADAHVSDDGSTIFVYGMGDEYAGGFVFVLDAETLAVRRRISIDEPVAEVHTCARDDLLLVRALGGDLFVCAGEEVRALSLRAKRASLSPSGRYLATRHDDGVRVWSLADVEDARLARGLPACFDPTGDRLVVGRRLYDGRTGAAIASLALEFGYYLEGGPASPWFHAGARNLIMMHGGFQVFDMRNGERRAAELRVFPHWFSVAYDRAGERIAAARYEDAECAVYEIPSGRVVATIPLAGAPLAMSADGSLVGARHERDVEVRALSGELRGRFAHPRGESSRWSASPEQLRFSHDGRRIASFVKDDGWRIWSLDGGREEHLAAIETIETLPDFAAPRPRDWDIEAGSPTVFVHRPTQTRIALPAAGPWAFNPGRPEIAACDDLHVELRAR